MGLISRVSSRTYRDASKANSNKMLKLTRISDIYRKCVQRRPFSATWPVHKVGGNRTTYSKYRFGPKTEQVAVRASAALGSEGAGIIEDNMMKANEARRNRLSVEEFEKIQAARKHKLETASSQRY